MIRKVKNNAGQATTEFAIVMFVLLIILVALSVLSDKVQIGVFIEHAISAASHNVVDSVSGVADAFNF
jgi:uncharacterized membrane protein